jgi:hypothetical protein
MNRKTHRKQFFILHPSYFILLFWLAACGESQSATVTSVSLTSPTVATTALAASPAAVTSPTSTNIIAPTVTPSPTATFSPLAAVDRAQIQKALRQLADTQSFRYQLQQMGELKSGASGTQFEASGEGQWQRPAFHQLITLKLNGQSQQIEHYGRDGQLFQRVVELVVWRKQEPAIAGPFPDPARLDQASNLQPPAKETLGIQSTTRLVWQEPAFRFLPSTGQPEGLGALSATNLHQAFAADKTSLAQIVLWVRDSDGQPIRYQLITTLTAGSDTLRYTATYDYTSFNDTSIKVDPPSDLLK